jgi:hypothetical protein
VAFARLSPSANRCFRSLSSAQGPISLLQVSLYLRCTQIIIRKGATVTPEANASNVAVSLYSYQASICPRWQQCDPVITNAKRKVEAGLCTHRNLASGPLATSDL